MLSIFWGVLEVFYALFASRLVSRPCATPARVQVPKAESPRPPDVVPIQPEADTGQGPAGGAAHLRNPRQRERLQAGEQFYQASVLSGMLRHIYSLCPLCLPPSLELGRGRPRCRAHAAPGPSLELEEGGAGGAARGGGRPASEPGPKGAPRRSELRAADARPPLRGAVRLGTPCC